MGKQISGLRKAIGAGSFYPDNPKKLRNFVEKTLAERKENILACIAPHACYMFSGKLAGRTLGKFMKKKDFILLGTNHSGIGNNISLSLEDFKTSLGIVKNNKALSEQIMKKFRKQKLDADVNETIHEKEHSLETQIPFLQINQKDKKFEIVPVLIKNLSYEECKKLAEILAEFVDENIALIVSSDFTHYGKTYGFERFRNIDEMKDFDNEVIFHILQKDSKKVYEKASESNICGLYGLTIIAEIAKILNWKTRKIDYYTSSDVTKDRNMAVGYAGIIFG